MPRKNLVHLRLAAFHRQAGRCYYCRVLMWLDDCKAFATRCGVSLRVAQWLQCTAEHLQARQDGGNNVPENITAACRFCNTTRHRRKIVLTADRFLKLVRRRVARGKWHVADVHENGLVK